MDSSAIIKVAKNGQWSLESPEKPTVPPVLFHSSPAEFEHFDPSKMRELGFHFGTKDQADHRAKLTGGTTRQYSVDIKNPLQLNDAMRWDVHNTLHRMAEAGAIPHYEVPNLHQKIMTEARSRAKQSGEGLQNTSVRLLADYIHSLGYDGIHYNNSGEGGGPSWIALKPEQIKKL